MDFLMELINYLARWGHFVFGIAWIGLLYYFNFVQGAYAAVATADAKVDLFTKQLPNAMWWFRWAAMMTFLTGLVLLYFLHEVGTLEGRHPVGWLDGDIDVSQCLVDHLAESENCHRIQRISCIRW